MLGPLELQSLHRNNRYKPNNSPRIVASHTDRQAELQQTHLITHLIWINDQEFLWDTWQSYDPHVTSMKQTARRLSSLSNTWHNGFEKTMGKITIESASANGKDRRTHVISSELSIKSKQFKLCFNISLFPQSRCDPLEVYSWTRKSWVRMWPLRGLFPMIDNLQLGCDPLEVYS